MKTKFFTIIMTTIAILCGFIMIPNCVRADDTTSSDFSNAEYTLEYDYSACSLTISNVTLASGSLYSAYFSTSSSETPEADYAYTNGMALTKYTNSLYISYKEIDSFVELNEDLYLWVVEYTGVSKTFVVSGQKLEKPDYPEYTDVFDSGTTISSSGTGIIFNVPWGTDTARTFEIKIGKITDTTILQSLKNGDSSSLSSLLTYSKSASSIYDENLTSDSKSYSTSISLSGLEDEDYYYLYVVFDDEDGKYVPIEGVTYAQARVYESSGTWFLFFYGSGSFTWTDFDTDETDSDSNETEETDDSNSTGKNDDSTTTTSSSLPYTGAFRWILATIIVIGIIGGVSYTKIQKYRGI